MLDCAAGDDSTNPDKKSVVQIHCVEGEFDVRTERRRERDTLS